MRDSFSGELVRLALADARVLLLTGDHGYALFDEFRRVCPSQYVNAGIAEQNMVGMASGLARVGFRPFVYGLAAFIPIRVVEQIKLDIAHDNLPVVLLGDGAGFVYSHLGTSHQSTEDIACTRSIPNLEVLSPADRHEMSACMRRAYNVSKPVYLRMGKSDLGDVHSEPVGIIEAGHLLKVRSGSIDRPGLIATGAMVRTAINVADELNLSVWSAPSLKPLDTRSVLLAAKQSSGLVTLEEHSILGGLGSAISEIVAEQQPVRLLRIGVLDKFSNHCGSYQYLRAEHGLDDATVMERICQFAGIARDLQADLL